MDVKDMSRRKWSPATTGPAGPSMAAMHGWSALPQVVPPFILLQMPNTGSLATCLLPRLYYLYMVKYKAAERGDGNWGILPCLCMDPKRSIYFNRTVKHY